MTGGCDENYLLCLLAEMRRALTMVDILYRATAPGFPHIYRVRVAYANKSFYDAVKHLYAFDKLTDRQLQHRLYSIAENRGPVEFDCRVGIFSLANGSRTTLLVTDVKQMQFGEEKLRDPDVYDSARNYELFLDLNWIEWMRLKEVEVEVEVEADDTHPVGNEMHA